MNDQKVGKKIFIRYARLLSVAVVLVLSAVVLSGCSLFSAFFGDDYVEFTRSRLAMTEGESFDLSDIIDSNVGSYRLSVSDGNIVSLNESTVTAKAVGTCTVTVQTNSDEDTLSIIVSEKQADSFAVDVNGELIQTVGELNTIEFVPHATGSIEKNNISWSENDKPAKIGLYDEPYEFTPSGVGITVIKAVCGQFSVEYTVRAYYAVDSEVSYSGKVEQSGEYEDIVFSVDIKSNAANPNDYIVWYCDGLVAFEGEQPSYTYSPTPGRHTIAAEVNGRAVYSIEVTAVGAIVPQTPTVVYDNVYPHFYVEFDAAGKAAVEITSPDGEVEEYCQTDSRYAMLFSDNGFDAGNIITVCSESNIRRSYSIRVKSLGDGDVITESEYSKPYSFVQLPNAAKPYIETQVLDGDLYVTSVEEYVEIAEYYIYFRKKSGSKIKVSFDCYIAFNLDGKVTDMWNDAFPIAATSGSYSEISVTKSGDVVHTSFYVNTVNNPSHDTVMNTNSVKQLHAVLPHINYDESKYRDPDHIYPIDRIERTTPVKYSDELYLAAENSTRPICASGSSAQAIYDAAREVLRKICTDDMTDVQKAHAIYDWIMWTVTYDDSAADAARDGEAYGAYYLEGVFGDGKTPFGGVKYTPYAVCDGMSKAYSLMCNIEGIPCVRVIGTAGSSLRNAGGHAWNKVKVNGAWYAVDCTWGDSRGSMKLDGLIPSEYELGLHDNLFLTDAEISSTHFEPYRSGESSIVYAPETASKKYSVYADMNYNGADIDCFVTKRQNQLNRVREIAGLFARSYTNKTSVYVPGGTNNGVYEIGYQGLDISFESEITVPDGELEAAVASAVRSVLPLADIKTYCSDNIVIILIKA